MRNKKKGHSDLIPTIEEDEEAAEASEDEGEMSLSTKGFGGEFRDLGSDDEDDDLDTPARQTWNFDSHETEGAAEPHGKEAGEGGLRAKIRERLQEKREAQGKSGDDPNSQQEAAAEASKKRTDEPAMNAEHLKTNIHFADLRLSRPLLRAISDAKFSNPTPIQRDVIPPALEGLDVLATAETGSGKTASFLLPILERLCQSSNVRARRRDSSGRIIMGKVATKAMVLIPTRELAVQCHAMLRDLAKYTFVTYQLVAGGFVSQDQASSLRQQPDIVIATPGRLLDHLLNSHSVHLELLEIVVFDEADRLLELGFRDECEQVLKRCSRGRQTMLFSATMSQSVDELSTLALVKPIRVHSSPVNRVAETLEQEFVKAPAEAFREAVLMSLVTRNYHERVIVFCATRQSAHRLAILFGLNGLKFTEIHGNLSQHERVEGLQRFQRGEADYMLATDLAARGLDLNKVETVINFHLPLDAARYIHRVGRTARMGRCGRAVTIYTPEEYGKVKTLGKQCCTKVKSKVVKRTVASEAVQTWVDQIKELRGDIDLIVQEESLEREERLADLLVNKSDNMQKHKKDIHSRPAKTWFLSNKEKRDLKTEENERIKTAEAAANQLPEQGPAPKRKWDDVEDPEEVRERKRKERLKDKLKKQKDESRQEREQEEAKMRAVARRKRKDFKPGKLGSDEVRPPSNKKKKKKGGKRR